MSRPVLARYRTIVGRTAEVLHPDTGAVLGVVGYARRSTPGCAGWWFERADMTHDDGYATRDAAVRALRRLAVHIGSNEPAS